jgi:hypothetical protein
MADTIPFDTGQAADCRTTLVYVRHAVELLGQSSILGAPQMTAAAASRLHDKILSRIDRTLAAMPADGAPDIGTSADAAAIVWLTAEATRRRRESCTASKYNGYKLWVEASALSDAAGALQRGEHRQAVTA